MRPPDSEKGRKQFYVWIGVLVLIGFGFVGFYFKWVFDQEKKKQEFIRRELKDFAAAKMQMLENKGFDGLLKLYHKCTEKDENDSVFYPFCEGYLESSFSGDLFRESVIEVGWNAQLTPNREEGCFNIKVVAATEAGNSYLEILENKVFPTEPSIIQLPLQ